MKTLFAPALVTLLLATAALAQAPPPPPAATGEADNTPSPPEADATTTLRAERQVTQEGAVTLAGVKVPYTVTAGTLPLATAETPQAYVFYIAYTRTGVDDPARRPITFCFNGGPGSSSVWLHLGAFGPRRIELPPAPAVAAPPYELVDNAGAILDATDLVFIDPVSTGFSRPAEDVSADQFHGVNEDVRAVAEFIRLYVSRQHRWLSPKFLAGESYGTTRAAALAAHLMDEHFLPVNGLILVSSVLDFLTLESRLGSDLSSVVFLPTLTATAWYHKRLDPARQADRAQTVAEARAFALGEYAAALLQGDHLPAADRERVALRLTELTGLPLKVIQDCNLRPSASLLRGQLLDEEDLVLGRFDSRYTGPSSNDVHPTPRYDPSMDAIAGAFTAGLNAYVRDELGFETDAPYEILGGVGAWNWEYRGRTRTLNVAESLRHFMLRNRPARVLVANGYYDLATPFMGSEHTFAHLNIPGGVEERVELTYYEAGHMMYTHEPSLMKLRTDIVGFIKRTLDHTSR
jgi:carboxypeptidase C (cathepsin A)